jgi:Response regulator containing CheY-like receiver, AAA-type ATPase, and DNA-binding domains
MPSEFRILIVEDNPVDEQLFKATLSPLSLNIDVARDGKDGYEKIKLTPYDLMILDLILPNTNGVEVLRKANEEKVALPLTIVYSALSAESYIMECLKLGASSYLIKPISALNLLNSISDCLALSMKKRTALAQPSVSLLDETPLTLTKAMMKVNASRQTGQIIVETADGVGILDYSSGKLSSARFKDLKGLHALETLRSLPHRSVTIQVVE